MAEEASGLRLQPPFSVLLTRHEDTSDHPATLNNRAHEDIMLCRSLNAYVAGCLQVHLYVTHHLPAKDIRQLDDSIIKNPLHGMPSTQ